jgi:hypothetical protein
MDVGTSHFVLCHPLRKRYYGVEWRTRHMRKHVMLVVLGVVLAATLGGCKKDG